MAVHIQDNLHFFLSFSSSGFHFLHLPFIFCFHCKPSSFLHFYHFFIFSSSVFLPPSLLYCLCHIIIDFYNQFFSSAEIYFPYKASRLNVGKARLLYSYYQERGPDADQSPKALKHAWLYNVFQGAVPN